MQRDALPLVMIRRFLGVVFISYGTVKLLGGQFVYDEWTITRSTANGPFLVWAFYGFSPAYARFIALCELVPGVMLLFPRTAFAGALALFPVALNITAMDFGFGFPGVKYLVTIYTLLLGILIWAERDRVWALLRSADGPTRPVGRLLNGLSLVFLLFVANLVAESTTPGPEGRAIRAATPPGGEAMVVLRSRMVGQSGIGRTGTVDLAPEGTSAPTVRAHVSRRFGFVPWRVDSLTAVR